MSAYICVNIYNSKSSIGISDREDIYRYEAKKGGFGVKGACKSPYP